MCRGPIIKWRGSIIICAFGITGYMLLICHCMVGVNFQSFVVALLYDVVLLLRVDSGFVFICCGVKFI